jgi:inner membrane transporter RhtA
MGYADDGHARPVYLPQQVHYLLRGFADQGARRFVGEDDLGLVDQCPGDGHALVAAVFWAAYILFGKKVGHLHAGHSVSLGLSVAAITVVPFGVWHAGSALWQPQILLAGLVVGAISSAIPISLEMVALKRLTPGAFGVMTSMEPAVAALLGLLVLNEQLTAPQWLAIGLVMCAAAGSAATSQPTIHHSAADEIVQ